MAAPTAALPAQGPDTLRGRVVRGPDGAEVAGQRVVLHRVTEAGGAPVDSAVSGPDGRFALPLDGAATAPGDSGLPVYLVTARYDGVLYFGPVVRADDPPPEYRVAVGAAEAGPGAEGLVLRSRTLVVAPDDGGRRVMDVIVAQGSPGRTPAGPGADGRGGGTSSWTVAVPTTARDVRVLPGAVDAARVELRPGEARISGVVPASGQTLVLGYRLPGGSPLVVAPRHRVERVEVVAREGAELLRVPGAEPAESLAVQGDRLARYRLEDRAAGDTIRVEFAGEAAGGREVLGWTAVGAGALLLGAAAWSWRRRRPRRDGAPAGRAGGGAA